MKRAAREWAGKAEDDYQAAQVLAQNKQRLYDQLCFHCQQSAEKYLKAILEELGLSIQKTHELELLLNQLLPHHPSLRSLRRGVKFLSNFSVTIRYPGDNATGRQAKSALRWADLVRAACRNALQM
jgi:HEPN domain-containing protein